MSTTEATTVVKVATLGKITIVMMLIVTTFFATLQSQLGYIVVAATVAATMFLSAVLLKREQVRILCVMLRATVRQDYAQLFACIANTVL